jgi:16S rRNA C1402 (ribose-2'-O) methylase RsmI
MLEASSLLANMYLGKQSFFFLGFLMKKKKKKKELRFLDFLLNFPFSFLFWILFFLS